MLKKFLGTLGMLTILACGSLLFIMYNMNLDGRLHGLVGHYLHSENNTDLSSAYRQLISQEVLKKLQWHEQEPSLTLGNLNISYFKTGDIVQLLNEIFSNKIYTFKTSTPQPFIIDCGSNIGLSIIFFKQLYPEAEIVGFEPHPKTFALLEKNIQENKFTGVTLVQKAVTADGQPIHFSDAAGALSAGKVAQSDLSVESVKLSEFISKQVDFLKIDIEGGEVEVFEELHQAGKLPLIKQMIIEYHNCFHPHSKTLLTLLSTLQNNGFEFRIFELNYNYKKVTCNGPAAMLIYAYQT